MKKLHHLSILSLGLLHSIYGMNLLQPYDILIRPEHTYGSKGQIFFMEETGFSEVSLNENGNRVNALHIWQDTQNVLSMLKGFNTNDPRAQLLNRIGIDPSDARGNVTIAADLDVRSSSAFAVRYFFNETWAISAYLPWYSIKLRNVSFQEQAMPEDIFSERIREFVTQDLVGTLCTLGNGLDIRPWTRTGVGDLTLLLEWFRDFPQNKPLLHNVRVHWLTGLSLPTGLRADEDRLLAFSFGNDGAFALPFELGLELYLAHYLKVGLDVQLTHIFGDTRNRRIKTDPGQSELFLLAKVPTYKDFGLLQKFSLYLEAHRIFHGFSAEFGYQFFKRGTDEITLKTNDFSTEIANNAQKLDEQTMHHIVLNFSYDFDEHVADDSWIKPYLSLFTRLPFNGKRAAMNKTIGVVLAFDF